MRNTKAADVMTAPVVTVTPDQLLTDAIRVLLRWHISGVPVVDEAGKIVGIVTEHDIVNFAFSGEAADTRVAEAMTKDVVSFPPEADLQSLLQACATRRIRRVPIVKDGKVVGIVSRRDILREIDKWYSRY